jgi:hypothetical protein
LLLLEMGVQFVVTTQFLTYNGAVPLKISLLKPLISGLYAATALCLAATTANANVMYNWVNTAVTPGLTGMNGQLEVTDEAYLRGSASLYITRIPPLSGEFCTLSQGGSTAASCVPPSAAVTGLVRMNFTLLGPSYFDSLGSRASYSTGFAANGSSTNYNIDLQLSSRGVAGVFDDLSFSARDIGLTMLGTETSWRIENYFQGQSVCRFCTTGYWSIDRSTIPVASVPLPSSLALFALPVLWFGLRRKIKAR